MADLLADGICRFDFLPGDNLYKQRMSNKFREERHYYLIPRAGQVQLMHIAWLQRIDFLKRLDAGSIKAD